MCGSGLKGRSSAAGMSQTNLQVQGTNQDSVAFYYLFMTLSLIAESRADRSPDAIRKAKKSDKQLWIPKYAG